jgi:hypothetical protein
MRSSSRATPSDTRSFADRNPAVSLPELSRIARWGEKTGTYGRPAARKCPSSPSSSTPSAGVLIPTGCAYAPADAPG